MQGALPWTGMHPIFIPANLLSLAGYPAIWKGLCGSEILCSLEESFSTLLVYYNCICDASGLQTVHMVSGLD